MRVTSLSFSLVLAPMIASGQVRLGAPPVPAQRQAASAPQGPTECTIIYDGDMG